MKLKASNNQLASSALLPKVFFMHDVISTGLIANANAVGPICSRTFERYPRFTDDVGLSSYRSVSIKLIAAVISSMSHVFGNNATSQHERVERHAPIQQASFYLCTYCQRICISKLLCLRAITVGTH